MTTITARRRFREINFIKRNIANVEIYNLFVWLQYEFAEIWLGSINHLSVPLWIISSASRISFPFRQQIATIFSFVRLKGAIKTEGRRRQSPGSDKGPESSFIISGECWKISPLTNSQSTRLCPPSLPIDCS